MKRLALKAFVVIFIIMFPSNFIASAQNDGPAISLLRLEIHNRSGQPVYMSLIGSDTPLMYHFKLAAGENRIFTIQQASYHQITSACGSSAVGTLKVTRQLRLVFTPCSGKAPNPGAPALEKIHLDDSPLGLSWFYQYNMASRSAFFPPTGGSIVTACQLAALTDVTIYYRPSTDAEVFSLQPAGFTQQLYARTADGWLGFDPGVAQAANIGSFRLRWVAPGTQTLSGGCSVLPVVWGPPPGICFDQPMEVTNIYASPDATSEVLTQLEVGEFAAIIGVTSDGDWLSVDLGPGNTGLSIIGWAPGSTANVNGPCDNLPIVTP
jgi:hypothetical protein